MSRSQYTLGAWTGAMRKVEKREGGAPCLPPYPTVLACWPSMDTLSQSTGTHSVGRRRAACCLSSGDVPQIFSVGVPGTLGELGTDGPVGVTGISIWSKRVKGIELGELADGSSTVCTWEASPQGPLLTNPPTPDPCREPAGCQPGPATYQVVPQSPQKLTLGFFTPLPLGCSSASCCFRGLLSARGVSTKLESWGSGVAFSPKGSDWRRETSSVATRASGLGVPVPWNPNVPLPRSYSLEKSRGAGMQTEHWALLLPDTCNCVTSEITSLPIPSLSKQPC